MKKELTVEELCKRAGIEFHPLKEGKKSRFAQIVDRRQELIEEFGFYRLGKKQKRALLDKDGIEVALFSKKHKDVADIACTLLNLDIYKKIKDIIDEEFKDVPEGFPKEQPDNTDGDG